jgi:hypothetical protein
VLGTLSTREEGVAPVEAMDVCIQIYALYWVVAKWIPKVKGLCLLNKMMCCYSFCTILKYIPFLSRSDFSFYTLSANLNTQTQGLSLRTAVEQWQKHVEFVAPYDWVLLVLIRRRLCLVQPYSPCTEAMLLVLGTHTTSREYCCQATHE